MQRHKSHFIIITLLLLVAMYERGIRIADMSEVPNSQRPANIFVIAGR